MSMTRRRMRRMRRTRAATYTNMATGVVVKKAMSAQCASRTRLLEINSPRKASKHDSSASTNNHDSPSIRHDAGAAPFATPSSVH